ncbi:DUF6199 family natural product biosynthesis protein [Paenibacillus sp. JZ16]|uniref:DUF6199 family natural product biosynthesis protein n=1 Tax=unclassified Paenibacillus TaxID=185978 RepID=UPI003FA6FEB7
MLILFAVVFLVRGVLRIRKPTWGSLYRIWKVKYESEPSSDYIQYIKSSGLLLLVLGSILFVAGILIVLL